MTPPEKEHIVKALQFELSKVETKEVRQRMIGHLVQINEVLAAQVGRAIGEKVPTSHPTAKPKGTADVPDQAAVLADATTPTTASGGLLKTKGPQHGRRPAQAGQGPQGRHPRGAAASPSPRSKPSEAPSIRRSRLRAKSWPRTSARSKAKAARSRRRRRSPTRSSVLFDAVYVPGGEASIAALKQLPDALRFIDEAYKHGKPIAASNEGVELVKAAELGAFIAKGAAAQGVLLETAGASKLAKPFLTAIAAHRFHNRQTDKIAA